MRTPLASLTCLLLASLGSAQDWKLIQTTNPPAARWSHAMSYDFIRGHTLMFGGTSTTSYLNDTWTYDGTKWTQLQPKTSPGVRRLHMMVHAITRTVMFGGTNASGRLNDTWIWDGKDWKQIQTTNSPSPRWVPAMAYDSTRNKVVLFGGFAGSGFVGDTWEFDFQNWKQITTTNSPSGRDANMAYDVARKRMVLFGGNNSSGRLADTWEYDGSNWTQITPKQSPSARGFSPMQYDPVRKRTVLFGGLATGLLGDHWEWDGTNWTQVKPKTLPPPRRAFDNLVWDVKRQRLVMFGGLDAAGRTAETWEYVGSQPLTGTPSTVSIATGGTQQFALDAGSGNRGRLYWIFGSVTGTSPGVTLASAAGSVTLPLNPDFWTDITIAFVNSAILTKTRGTLDTAGKASASFNVPRITNSSAIGLKFHHAALIYDAQSNFYMASNAVELTLAR